jgi:hypothetical protein
LLHFDNFLGNLNELGVLEGVWRWTYWSWPAHHWGAHHWRWLLHWLGLHSWSWLRSSNWLLRLHRRNLVKRHHLRSWIRWSDYFFRNIYSWRGIKLGWSRLNACKWIFILNTHRVNRSHKINTFLLRLKLSLRELLFWRLGHHNLLSSTNRVLQILRNKVRDLSSSFSFR